MKILQVINSMATGGAEKLLLETIPLYVERGIKMDILVLNENNYPFMEKLKALNICNVYSLGNGSVYNPLNAFKIIPYLRKYDIVHVHLFPSQYWVVLAKWFSFSKTKLVFTEHNTHNRRMENSVFRFCDKIIYSGYKKVICITQEVRDILKQHLNAVDEKLIIIENGVNIATIKNATIYQKKDINSIAEEDKVLIQVAAFREQKDQQTLIKAMQFLPDSVKLLLVGDGPFKEACELLSTELELENRVLFLGLRMDVPNLLKTADIIVLSSKYEGLSLSSIEGMAAGKPFVASDVPGLTNIVKGAGILFKQGAAEELAQKIIELLENKNHYDTVAIACQNRAEQYDINVMIEKHVNLYAQIYK